MDKKSNTFLETKPIGKLMAKYAIPSRHSKRQSELAKERS